MLLLSAKAICMDDFFSFCPDSPEVGFIRCIYSIWDWQPLSQLYILLFSAFYFVIHITLFDFVNLRPFIEHIFCISRLLFITSTLVFRDKKFALHSIEKTCLFFTFWINKSPILTLLAWRTLYYVNTTPQKHVGVW